MITSRTHEKELVEKVIGGDVSAFREVFYRYKDKLFSYCYRYTKCGAAAEEIVHDVLLKIWTDREQIDPERSFSSYLYTITKNYALNFLKKAAADKSLKEKLFYYFDTSHRQPEDQLICTDLENIARQAIALLPPQRQRIYQMSRNQAMTHEEIAQHLGISRHTVRNHMIEALKSIKNYLHVHADMSICLLYAIMMSFI